jgi:FkbM family methyltransferase
VTELVPGRPSPATPLEQEALHQHLGTILETLGITCVLDVGAADGRYGQALRLIGYEGWIVSFEPVEEAFAKLEEVARDDPHWRAHRLALGDSDGERSINVAKNPVFSSFRERTEYGGEHFAGYTNVTRTESVPLRRLDSVAGQCLEGVPAERLFLKVDTQGWDLDVLRGAERTLPDVVGLQSEVSLLPLYDGAPGWDEALSFMKSKGFELSGLQPTARDRKLRIVELDCVMVRPDEIRPGT